MTIFKVLLKLLLVLASIGYLIFALTKGNKEDSSRRCEAVNIVVNDSAGLGFITPMEARRILRSNKLDPQGKRMDFIDTRKIERTLMKNPFVSEVYCFKTAGDEVRINIEQRMPLLRVMADNGDDYFVDEKGKIMPRMHYTANLVVATGHISKRYATMHLYDLGKRIRQDEFLDNQIEQVYVDSIGHVEMVPRVGDHIIKLGVPDSLGIKLSHLKTFYRKVLNEVGWNKYSVINLEYSNQIICKKKIQ